MATNTKEIILISLLVFIVLLIPFSVDADIFDFGEKTQQDTILKQGSTFDIIKTKDGYFKKVIYSGTQNVFEDGEWKTIIEAKSLKDKGFEIQYLESDDNFPLEVLDFNLTSIKVKFKQPSDSEELNKDIPIKIWEKNKSKEIEFNKEIEEGKKNNKELKDKYKDIFENKLQTSKKFKDVNETFEATYPFNVGDILEYGFNSTTITLQDANTENLEDTFELTNDGVTDSGDNDEMLVGDDGVSNTNNTYRGLIKFYFDSTNIQNIHNATLKLYQTSGNQVGRWNAGQYLEIYQVSNQTWNENDCRGHPSLFPCPSIGNLITSRDVSTISSSDGVWANFTVTSWANETFATNQQTNISFAINFTADSLGKRHDFATKEYSTDTTKRPILELTFDGILINAPIDNQEILNTLSTSLNVSTAGGFDSSILYSFSDGIKNYSLCSGASECNTTITFPRQGYFNLTVFANNSDNTWTSQTVNDLFVTNKTNLDAVKDTFINGFRETDNYGGSQDLDVDPSSSSDTQQLSLFFFNLSSQIPSNSNYLILNSTASFFVFESDFVDEGDYVDLYRIIRDWNEGTGDLDVNDATINGTTWYERWFEDNANDGCSDNQDIDWCSSGMGADTDYNSTIFSFGSPPLDGETGWMVVDVYNLTKEILIEGNEDYGFIMKTGSLSEGATSENIEIYSRETNTVPHINLTYYSQNTPPTPLHLSTNNSNFSTISGINLLFNVTDDNDYVKNVSLFINGGLNQTKTNQHSDELINFTFSSLNDGTYNYFIRVFDSDNEQNDSTTQSFTLDSTAPLVTIDIPQPLEEFNFNTSISLNYTITDSGVGVDSCWFNIDGTTNATITNCQNTTFDTSDGSHTLYFFANDTLNNIRDISRQFTVSLDAPAISLDFPQNGTYLNYNENIYLNYTATDSNDLSTVELWHNLNGSFALNQTFLGVESGKKNFSIVNVSEDGIWKWNIWANDTTSSGRFSKFNFTFTTDTTFPTIQNLSAPVSANSQTVRFNSTIEDLNLNACWYKILNSTGGIEITNTTYTCGTNDTQFVVSDFTTYSLRNYANDSAGNENNSQINFTTFQSTTTTPSGGGSATTEEKSNVVALINPDFPDLLAIATQFTDIELAIFYRAINDFCGQKINTESLSIVDNSKQCSLSKLDLQTLRDKIEEEDNVDLTIEELNALYLQYKNNRITNVLVDQEDVIKYNLIQAIVGNLESLRLSTPSVDKYFAFNQPKGNKTISFSISANKELKSCTVTSVTPEFECNIIGNDSVRVEYYIKDTDFFSNVFQGQVSILTNAEEIKQESVRVPIIFRTYNLGYLVFDRYPAWIAVLISISGMVLISISSYLNRKKINKYAKKIF